MKDDELFLKVFANLPIPLRSEVIYIDPQYGTMSWNVVYIEVKAGTEVGSRAIKTLKEMKIIY